jgi:hypothetical protein
MPRRFAILGKALRRGSGIEAGDGHVVEARPWECHRGLERVRWHIDARRHAPLGAAGQLGDDDHRPGLRPVEAAVPLKNAQARVPRTARPDVIGPRVPQHAHGRVRVLAHGGDGTSSSASSATASGLMSALHAPGLRGPGASAARQRPVRRGASPSTDPRPSVRHVDPFDLHLALVAVRNGANALCTSNTTDYAMDASALSASRRRRGWLTSSRSAHPGVGDSTGDRRPLASADGSAMPERR